MNTLFRLFSAWPLFVLHGLGWAVGWLAFLGSPVYRRRFLANAAQAGYGLGAVHGAVGQAGMLIAELPRLWMGRAPAVLWDGQALIEAAHAAGKGILFLTPHLGCVEATAQAYASRYGQAHGPITVLYRPARKPWLRELVDQARARPGLATAQTTLSGVRQMLKALRQGEAVGLLPDQVPPAGLGVDAPFFGREAWTMTLSSRLALQTGATVLLAWGERRSFGRGFVIHLRALLAPLADDPLQAAAQVNAEMQRLIRECPQQYLWGYARYKRPTRGTPAAGTASR